MNSDDALPGLKSARLAAAAAGTLPFIRRAALASFPAKGEGPAELRAAARLYLDRPGKMLRPLLTALVLESFGKNPRSYAEILGAIELMEAATVSFDDIIDGSDIRRGGPSTHKIYGAETAYLAYQAAYNHAYRAFLEPAAGIDAGAAAVLASSLSREIFAYGWGQAQELYWTARKTPPSPRQYLAMTWDRIRFLSFNGPFRIGAVLGGAPANRLKYFEEAGSWLGMAYHLHGDELNLLPRSREWGKPLADDITGGRYTFLYLSALRLAGPAERRKLSLALGSGRISAGGLKNVIDIVCASGAVQENRAMIDVFYGRALAALGKCRLRSAQGSLLSDLFSYMAYDRKK